MKDPSKILELLFAIEPESIARDLRLAEDDFDTIAEEIADLRAIPQEATTPETDARRSHLFMVQAHKLCGQDNIEPEERTFFAAFGACRIAQDAETLASNKGACAELLDRIEQLERRSGLGPGEYLEKGEAPEFDQLNEEFGKILEGVFDTVFLFALRRYHLNDAADLYERDLAEFEIQREIGRRAFLPSPDDSEDVEKMLQNGFLKKFGRPALERIVSRSREIIRGRQ